MLFTRHRSSDPSPETERVVAEFYEQLEGPGQSPFASRLLASAKSQTVDLAMAALSVMIPLARYPFGVKVTTLEAMEKHSRTAGMFGHYCWPPSNQGYLALR